MDDTEILKAVFDDDMQRILTEEHKADLNSARFRQMVAQYGGLETAHRLLKPDRNLPANTFSYLRSRNRLDLSMERYVVMEKYKALFSDEERVIAQWRLDHES